MRETGAELLRNKDMIESFNNAISGVVYAVRTQRNMKVHCFMAIIILVLSFFFDLQKSELLALFVSITFVIFAELVNTSIEAVVDIIVDEYHPRAKVAKDVAAGAVFITAFNALMVGYLIFYDKIEPTATSIMRKIHTTPMHIVFIGLIITLLSVLILKAYFNKGTPFQGGMPSGHAALSFSILTAICLLTDKLVIFILASVLSLLVVQSRVEAKIHNVYEVIVGSFVGIFIMLLLFKLVTIYHIFQF